MTEMHCARCGVPIDERLHYGLYAHLCPRRGNPHYAAPRREELRERARRDFEETYAGWSPGELAEAFGK